MWWLDLEFDGISVQKLKEIAEEMNVKADIFPSKRHGPVCTRERGYYTTSSTTDDSCYCGYYYCYGYNCGSYRSGRRGRDSSCNSSSRSDCGSGESAEGLAILLVIIIVIALIIIFLPEIVAITVVGIDLTLALLIGLFDILTLGIFRNRFYRTSIHFHSTLSTDQEKYFVQSAVASGGLPRNYLPNYSTIGFFIFRLGAYLFIPSLVGTALILYFKPSNRWIYWSPVAAFVLSILLIIWGTAVIKNRTTSVTRSFQ